MSADERISESKDREIVVERLIHTPRALVFKAFSDVEHIGNWWGPNGFKTTTHEFDFRIGGVWRHTMHGPDGTDYPNYSVFTEIREPELISYNCGTSPDEKFWFHSTISFEARGNDTNVRLRLLLASTDLYQEVIKHGAVEGGQQTLERLEKHLLGD